MVTQSQLQKLQRGSQLAKTITTGFMLVATAGMVFVAWSILTAPGAGRARFEIGSYVIAASAVTNASTKAWLLVNFVLMFGLLMMCLWRVRLIFVNLARGEIFTARNVENLRKVAWIFVAFGVYGFAGPLLTQIALGFLAPHAGSTTAGISSVLAPWPFLTGGLLMLASWIMAVGLGVREDADELRRDVELTI